MVKVLSNKKTEGVDEETEIELPSKEVPKKIILQEHPQPQIQQICNPQPVYNTLPPQTNQKSEKERRDDWNDKVFHPTGNKLISTKTWVGIWVVIGLLLLILATNVVWSNRSFADKTFAGNTNVQVAPANVTTPVYIQFNSTNQIIVQPNVTLSLPQGIIDDLHTVATKLNNFTNSS